MADVLVRQGVRFVFTLCGGHISPILVAAKARGLRVVDTRHEATAVFAADAVARLTGVPGFAAVTAGPGVTNTITALKNAQMAQSPLVLVGGATATLLRGRGAAAGHRPDGARAAARQEGDARRRAWRARAGPRRGLSSRPRRACPARSSSRLPSTSCTPRRSCASGTARRPAAPPRRLGGRAPSSWYVGRHLERLFRDAGPGPDASAGGVGRPRPSRTRRGCAARRASSPRPSGRCSSSAARRSSTRRAHRSSPPPCARSACPSTSRAWPAGCSAATTRCSSATGARRRCARPTS